jgi:hypothetical protein
MLRVTSTRSQAKGLKKAVATLQGKIKKLHSKTEDKLAKERKALISKACMHSAAWRGVAQQERGCVVLQDNGPQYNTVSNNDMMIAQAAKVEAKFAKEEQAANKKGKDVREQLAQEAHRLDQEYREMYRKEYLNLINATVIEELDLYTGMICALPYGPVSFTRGTRNGRLCVQTSIVGAVPARHRPRNCLGCFRLFVADMGSEACSLPRAGCNVAPQTCKTRSSRRWRSLSRRRRRR